MDWKLELVIVPVADVDRAKRFYTRISDDVRIVQLTPPGSACSIALGTGLGDMPPGSLRGLRLVVADIEAAHA